MAPIVRITVIEKGKPTHSHLFQKNLVVVGKHPSSDLQLENSLVSRQHALLRIVEQSMEFEDLESTNGSFLDGRRIKTEALKNGDQVNVGPYSLTFNLVPDLTPLLAECYQKVVSETPGDDFEKSVRDNAQKIVQQMCGEGEDAQSILPVLLDELLKLGPLEPLLRDQTVTEIMVNNWNQIFVERSGEIFLHDRHFSCSHSLRNCIDRILAPTGRRLDEASPMVDTRLPDGSRINIIIPPIALGGPTLTIRKFSRAVNSLDQLMLLGTLSKENATLLQHFVLERKNITITGGTGSGKTTMLNALASTIPPGERLITI
ncbi:MAG TPA: ATPase, T2SS/T4P/T4SS family, partial [Bdellovibrionota bacterium]|nr:ATPase, T2SS/T4P/T4SS family [Bdellovibrionota bacterium]